MATSSPSLGITHNQGRRVLTELQAGAAVIPAGWRVEQDHPRRGLVVRVPADEPFEKVLRWAILTVSLLGGSRGGVRWYADAYMPT